MSKLIRTILIIAFAIFIIGGIWAIVAVNHQPEKKTVTKTKTEKTTTTTTIPAVPTSPTPVTINPAPAPAPTAPKAVNSPRRTTVTRRVITTFEDGFSASASASASADGSSAWASAEAN